ncbi:MAG: hypothetical protein V1784_12475 [bacterium]
MRPRLSQNPLAIVGFFVALCPAMAQTGLWRPQAVCEDSLALRTERGVELTRQSEHLCWTESVLDSTDLQLQGSWKSEWIKPSGQVERRRQDGRWHLSALHPYKSWLAFWLATQGELFDERATPPAKVPSPSLESLPRTWQMQTPFLPSSPVSPTTIRILRGGGGLQLAPLTHTEVVAGTGLLEDRRFGHITSGPLWEATAKVTGWDISGYVQDLELRAESENPGSQHNRDLHGRYEAHRDFAPGTSNHALISATELHRGYLLDAAGRLATRRENSALFNDRLTYAIRPDLGFNLSGELRNTKTEIAQAERKSSLKEVRAAFDAALLRRAGRFSGTMGIGMQSVTQTIDGDILQGRQTNLRMDAGFQPSLQDSFYGGFEVSKYQLDTRDPRNFDDRDELRFAFLLGGVGRLNPQFGWEIWTRATLDHLVYLFKERSANNRWTRLLLLSSRLHHRPSRTIRQTFAFEVSANYQAFDYEFDPRQVRSTVFRKLQLGDSLAVEWTRWLAMVLRVTYQREELGRLFWHEFQEERSDEVTAVYSSIEFPCRIRRQTLLIFGGRFDHRRGIRFPTADFEQKEVFQDLQTYGPTWGLRHNIRTTVTINGAGQFLRQLELGREDRWLVMGEIGVSFRW